MDKRLNKKCETYVGQFKSDVRTKIMEIGFDDKSKVNELIEGERLVQVAPPSRVS